MMIILFVGVGVLAYYAFYNKDTGKISFSGNRTAEEQLKERFVRGEIDERTYLKMKAAIQE